MRRPARPLHAEALEDRTTPAVTVSGLNAALGTVTFAGDAAADTLVLAVNPITGNLEHNLAGEPGIDTSDDLDPTPGVVQTLTVGTGTARNITVTLGGGDDSCCSTTRGRSTTR